MTTFSYKALNGAGAEESGTLEASSESMAFDVLNARGLTAFELLEGSGAHAATLPWYRQDISFSGGRLSLAEQALFAKLLASLMEARLPLTRVLEIAQNSTSNAALSDLLRRMNQRIADGEDIGVAFEAENTKLSPLFTSFMKLGSASSDLAPALKRLGSHLEKQAELRRKVSSALIYPSILLVAALSLFLIVAFYLAPNLQPIFDAVGKPPPPTIAWLLSVRSFVKAYWAFLLFAVALLPPFILALRGTRIGRSIARVTQHLPLVGELQRLRMLTELTGSASLLLKAGLPLADALRRSSEISPSRIGYSELFADAADSIEAGLPASAVFEDGKHLPSEYKQLFTIGEETNQLAPILATLTSMLTQTLETKTQRALTLLTPIITLVMGLGVGLLIYTLMGAVLEVNEIAF